MQSFAQTAVTPRIEYSKEKHIYHPLVKRQPSEETEVSTKEIEETINAITKI